MPTCRSFGIYSEIAFAILCFEPTPPSVPGKTSLLMYESNVTLSQERHSKRRRKLSSFDLTSLRNILSGAVHTEQQRFKANCAQTAQCPWCESREDETVEHLFWSCAKWQPFRQNVVSEFADVLPQLPPCMRECGLFPQSLLHMGPFTTALVNRLVPKVQMMMLSILREREKLI